MVLLARALRRGRPLAHRCRCGSSLLRAVAINATGVLAHGNKGTPQVGINQAMHPLLAHSLTHSAANPRCNNAIMHYQLQHRPSLPSQVWSRVPWHSVSPVVVMNSPRRLPLPLPCVDNTQYNTGMAILPATGVLRRTLLQEDAQFRRCRMLTRGRPVSLQNLCAVACSRSTSSATPYYCERQRITSPWLLGRETLAASQLAELS